MATKQPKKAKKLSLNATDRKWEDLQAMREITLKHFPRLSMNQIVIDLLEDIHPRGLLDRGLITKEEYKSFTNRYLSGELIITPDNVKLMKL